MLPDKLDLNVSLKEDAKTPQKFLDVVRAGIGKWYEPTAIRREAQAKADAQIIQVKADIVARELLERTAQRISHTEVQRQANVEAIVDQARLALPETIASEPVTKDWSAFFFDSAKDVSEEHLQTIWANVLAKEVASPRSISKRTLEYLKTISKMDADLFERLLRYVLFDPIDGQKFLDDRRLLACTRSITRGEVDYLEDIGLLKPSTPIPPQALHNRVVVFNEKSFCFRHQNPEFAQLKRYEDPFNFEMSVRGLTSVGRELSKVANRKANPDYIENLRSELSKLELDLVVVPDLKVNVVL
jgi:hypothetical protein